MVRAQPLSHASPIRGRIEARLAEVGKSARGAGLEAGLSDSAVRNIMEGRSRSPRFDTIRRLAAVLQVEPAWFIETSADLAAASASPLINRPTRTYLDLYAPAELARATPIALDSAGTITCGAQS